LCPLAFTRRKKVKNLKRIALVVLLFLYFAPTIEGNRYHQNRISSQKEEMLRELSHSEVLAELEKMYFYRRQRARHDSTLASILEVSVRETERVTADSLKKSSAYHAARADSLEVLLWRFRRK